MAGIDIKNLRPTKLLADYGPLDVLARPLRDDVNAFRESGMLSTNVPWTAVAVTESGFDMGYEGDGTMEFAANILNAWVPPGSDGKRPVRALKEFVSDCAVRLHAEFVRKFLLSDSQTLYIPKYEIEEFILERAPGALKRT